MRYVVSIKEGQWYCFHDVCTILMRSVASVKEGQWYCFHDVCTILMRYVVSIKEGQWYCFHDVCTILMRSVASVKEGQWYCFHNVCTIFLINCQRGVHVQLALEECSTHIIGPSMFQCWTLHYNCRWSHIVYIIY